MFTDRPDEQFLHVADDRVERQDAGPHDLPPAEREQLVGERDATVGGALDLLHVAGDHVPALRVGDGRHLDLLGHEGGVVDDDGEQVVEVVGDAAGELAEAFQPLRLL